MCQRKNRDQSRINLNTHKLAKSFTKHKKSTESSEGHPLSDLSKHPAKKEPKVHVVSLNVILMVLSVLVTTALFVAEFFPAGRDPVYRAFMMTRAWVPVAIFAVGLVGMLFFMKMLKYNGGKKEFVTHDIVIPTVFFLWTLLIQLGFVYMCGVDHICSVMSSENLTYYYLTPTSNIPEFLEWWFSQMRAGVAREFGPYRQGTHLPGWPLLLYAIFSMVGGKAPFPCVIAVVVLSSLTVFPLYFLTRTLFGLETAILTCITYLYVPSLILHIPWMDLTLGFLNTLVVLLFFLAVKRESIKYALVAGLMYAVTLLMCFAPLITPALLLTWDLLTRKKPSRSLRTFLAFAVGTLLPLALVSLLFNMPIFQSLYWVYFQHMYWEAHGREEVLQMRDPRIFSFPRNLYYFFAFAGASVSFLFFVSVARQLHDFIKTRAIRPFLLSFLATFLALLWFLRLEFVRTGLFLIPLMVIIGANELAQTKESGKRVTLVLALQFLQTMIFYLLLRHNILLGYLMA